MEKKLLIALMLLSLSLAYTVDFELEANECGMPTVSLKLTWKTTATADPPFDFDDYFSFNCWTIGEDTNLIIDDNETPLLLTDDVIDSIGIVAMGWISSVDKRKITTGNTIYGREAFYGVYNLEEDSQDDLVRDFT